MKWKPLVPTRTDEAQTSGRRDLILALIPALILVLVGINQAYSHSANQLSAWKGGGFGMFSGVDRDYYRVFRAQANDQAGNTIALDMDSIDKAFESGFSIDFQQMYEDARSHPTDARLQEMINVMGKALWTRSEDGKSAAVSRWNDGGRGTFATATIDIQLYAMTYDQTTNMVEPELIKSYSGEPSE
jgi:hypothetical protein